MPSLNGKYQHAASRHDHEYGKVVSSIKFEEKVFEEIEEEHFKDGLATFLLEEKKELLSSRTPGSDAKLRAKKIYKRKGKGSGFSANQTLNLVEEAIEQGYIWKFRLEEPWHPHIFHDDERITTFPFQHKYAVLYSARMRHSFFSRKAKIPVRLQVIKGKNPGKFEEWKKKLQEPEFFRSFYDHDLGLEKLHNPESILEQGNIRAGTAHKESGNEAEDGDKEEAIWLSQLDKTQSYPLNTPSEYLNNEEKLQKLVKEYTGIEMSVKRWMSEALTGVSVIEVEVPTGFIVQQKNSGQPRMESLSDMKKYYDKPGEYNPNEEFKVARSKETSEGAVVLPLKYINGVWDREKYDVPYFMTLKHYVGLLESEFPELMPESRESHLEGVKPHKKLFKGEKQLIKDINKFRENSSWNFFIDQFGPGKAGIDYWSDWKKRIEKGADEVFNYKEHNQEVDQARQDFQNFLGDYFESMEGKNISWEETKTVKASDLISRSEKAWSQIARAEKMLKKARENLITKEKTAYEKLEKGKEVNEDFLEDILEETYKALLETPKIKFDVSKERIIEFLIGEDSKDKLEEGKKIFDKEMKIDYKELSSTQPRAANT